MDSYEVMRTDWCELPWTEWRPLKKSEISGYVKELPGVYRIRGIKQKHFTYIGQTNRSLRARLHSLRSNIEKPKVPFNDPHTAAPHLWLLRKHKKIEFEFSCAPVSGGKRILRGTEDMLLWMHRVSTKRSTVANYGRFYPGYSRSKNRDTGIRAKPLASSANGPDFSISAPVLKGKGNPLNSPWWKKIPLAEELPRNLATYPGIYCIFNPISKKILYVGQARELGKRLAIHKNNNWRIRQPWVAIKSVKKGTADHILREMESDILGWEFRNGKRPPKYQY